MLFRGWPEVAGHMAWRDVDERPEWREAYGHLVPVLTRGEEVVCALQPDPVRIARCFGAMANPL